MKVSTKLTDEQRAGAAIAAKAALSQGPMTEFFDRVEKILDEYEARDAALVTERPRKRS